MGLGNLIRKAATAADSASEKASAAWEITKLKAESLSGDDSAVYDGALSDVADAIVDSGQMNFTIADTIDLLRKNNPHK